MIALPSDRTTVVKVFARIATGSIIAEEQTQLYSEAKYQDSSCDDELRNPKGMFLSHIMWDGDYPVLEKPEPNL